MRRFFYAQQMSHDNFMTWQFVKTEFTVFFHTEDAKKTNTEVKIQHGSN